MPDSGRGRWLRWAGRGLIALPERLPVIMLALALAGLLTVLAGAFQPWLVLPLAAALVALSWQWLPAAPAVTRTGLVPTVVLLAGVGLWWWWSSQWVAEYVVVNRDPGFLTLQALWLSGHSSAPIPVGAAAGASVFGASAGTEAFWLQDGALYAQGNTMVPALLAMPGWIGGTDAVLSANLLIGAVALIAVYGAARRIAGPVIALVPTAALGCALPFLVGTRAAYTEPLTVVFLAGAVTVALGGWRGDRRGPGLLVGLLVGAVATARIDGAVAVVGLLIGAVLAALVAVERGPARQRAVVAGVAALAMTGLGLWDVLMLSPQYVRDHRGQLTALLLVTALTAVIGAVVVALPDRWWRGSRRWVRDRRRPIAAVAAGGVLALAVVLISRPLWWQGRETDPDSGFGIAVLNLQAAAGQTLDAARSYDEQSVTWVSWYLGAAAVLLGVLGFALLTRRAVLRRDTAWVTVLAVLGVAVVFPLVRVNITPDQVWAARRLLPATFPGLLLAGAAVLALLVRPGRWVWPRRALALALSATLVAVPVSTWHPGASVVELSGRLTQAEQVCAELAEHGVQRVVWTHSSPFRYLATLRVVCDVEVVEFVADPDPSSLSQVLAAWGGGPVAVGSFDPGDYAWTGEPSGVGTVESTTLGRSLTGVPTTVDRTESTVWLGMLRTDGTVDPF